MTLPTGTLVTLLSPDGERSFLTDRAANLKLGRADLPHALLDGVDLLHVSGYALFEEGPRAAVLDIIAEAKRRKIPFSVDPASYSFLQEVGPSTVSSNGREARSFFFPNEDEAAVLTGEAEPAGAARRACADLSGRRAQARRGGRRRGRSASGRWSVAAPTRRRSSTHPARATRSSAGFSARI